MLGVFLGRPIWYQAAPIATRHDATPPESHR
jgi:hypothetical protein